MRFYWDAPSARPRRGTSWRPCELQGTGRAERGQEAVVITTCNREELNGTPRWICFFDFNLCFSLLLLLLSYRMACLGEPCPSAVQLTGRSSDPAHLWMAARKKQLTHPLTEAGRSRRCFARLMALLLYSLTASPSLILFKKLASRPQ